MTFSGLQIAKFIVLNSRRFNFSNLFFFGRGAQIFGGRASPSPCAALATPLITCLVSCVREVNEHPNYERGHTHMSYVVCGQSLSAHFISLIVLFDSLYLWYACYVTLHGYCTRTITGMRYCVHTLLNYLTSIYNIPPL